MTDIKTILKEGINFRDKISELERNIQDIKSKSQDLSSSEVATLVDEHNKSVDKLVSSAKYVKDNKSLLSALRDLYISSVDVDFSLEREENVRESTPTLKDTLKEVILRKLRELQEVSVTTYLKPFNKTDYNTYAGANDLPNGSAPMIYENDDPEFTVVLSGSDDSSNCVISVILGDDSEYVYYTPTDVNPSVAQANTIITDLIQEDNIVSYLKDPESGFEKVI